MIHTTLEQARDHLKQLLDAALRGEEVVIATAEQEVCIFATLAQEITERMPILSADMAFDVYPVERVW
jgi:antitoxin (DNA-binding transcriptional repressor) of toxin-antitoxin stability system